MDRRRLSARRCWFAVPVELPEALADRCLALLGRDCLGVETLEASGGRTGLRFHYEDEPRAREAAASASRLMAGRGAPESLRRPRVERVEDQGWVERWRSRLGPLALGKRFEILPRAALTPTPGRVPLKLTPGRAFGTGEHPTTRLCVEMLELYVDRGSRWLDLGCGTAILASVAALCGAAEVLACDQDPDAVEVARETVRANGIAERVPIIEGSLPEVAGYGAFDGVVSNIDAEFLVARSPALCRALLPQGTLIASGFLLEEVARVRQALEQAGLREVERAGLAEWGVWVGVPRGGR